METWRALKTEPMPPLPILETISNPPMILGAGEVPVSAICARLGLPLAERAEGGNGLLRSESNRRGGRVGTLRGVWETS
ncbi:MAG: hypothetical protein AMXMBFR7_32000 [Planctomycetota bacterium]